MQTQILTTLFLIFVAFATVFFADINAMASLFVLGLATLLGALQLSTMKEVS